LKFAEEHAIDLRMSGETPPTRPSDRPPPASRTRPRTAPDVFCELTRDGAAVVLSFARAMLEQERRLSPKRFAASLQVFAFRVDLAVHSTTEGSHKDGVFIAPLFRVMRARGELTSCPSLPAFKQRLYRAHLRGFLQLARCEEVEGVNPLVLAASVLHRRRPSTFNVVRRWPHRTLRIVLSDTLDALPRDAYLATEDYARKVRRDEVRRAGRARLITLSPEGFAARVQMVANESPQDVPVAELFLTLDDRGEVTGMNVQMFGAWLRAAHRAGRLVLRASKGAGKALDLLQRTATPLPIPWGRPPLPVRPPSPRRPDF
jgi:hypothetical protein